MFKTNSRISRKDDSIYFEEEDVLLTKYSFNDDIEVLSEIDLNTESFGIVLVDKSRGSDNFNNNNYFLRVRSNSIELFFNNSMLNKTLDTISYRFPEERNFIFRFTKIGKDIALYIGEDKIYEYKNIIIGDYDFGIYSTKGNKIKNIDIRTPSPIGWNANMKNTMGGHITYINNGFVLSGCKNNAEVIQNNIDLKDTMYHIRFDISDGSDIKAYLMKEGDERKSDDEKNLLHMVNDGYYISENLEEGKYVLKFKGTNGTIKNISMSMNRDDIFIETENDNFKKGSKLIVDTKKIKRLLFKSVITKTPLNDNYFLFSNREENIKEEVVYNKECTYIIEFEEDITIKRYESQTETEHNHFLDYEGIEPLEVNLLKDEGYLEIFYNIDAVINSLIYIDGDNIIKDPINDNEIVFYVENDSIAPIIVMSDGEPFDLSGAYRKKNGKYVFTNKVRKVYEPEREIVVNKKISEKGDSVKVYGVMKNDIYEDQDLFKIDKVDNIENFAKKYTEYFEADLQVDKDQKIIIFEDYRDFDYLVVDYLIDDSYTINNIEGTNTYSVHISSEKENIQIVTESKKYKNFDDGRMLIDLVAEKDKYIVLDKIDKKEVGEDEDISIKPQD